MGSILKTALLIDGGTLHGVSLRQGGGAPDEGAAPEFKAWQFARALPAAPAQDDGAEPQDGAVPQSGATRADAFASATKELPIEEGAPLALPPELLITRVLTLPATDAESLAPMVRLKMEKFAPVADDELEVDYEVIGATENETRVFAVALPISILDELASDLEASGLAVTRIDSAILCEWRAIEAHGRAAANPAPGEDAAASEADAPADADAPPSAGAVFVVALPSGRFDLIAADSIGPVFARTLGVLSSPEDLAREVTLSLLDLAAENPRFLAGRHVLVAPDGLDPAYTAAVTRAVGGEVEALPESSLMPFVQAALEREDEDGCIDIVPDAWREDERASAVKRNFIYGAIAAVALWVVIFAAFTMVPKSIERQTKGIRGEVSAIMPDYMEVADLRSRVRLIQSYEDRSHSALEMLRAICERLPDGVTLGNFGYEKNDDGSSSGKGRDSGGIRVTGDAPDSESVNNLKDLMDDLDIFEAARLKGPNRDSKGRYKFDLDWRFAEGGE